MFTKITANMNNHQSLENRPNIDNGKTAEQLKILYDKAANDLKTGVNNLIDELEDTAASELIGAIAIDEADTSDANVKSKIIELNARINQIKTNGVNSGVITEAMLDSTYSASLAKKNGDVQTGLNAEKVGGKTVSELDNASSISATEMYEGDLSEANVQAKLEHLHEEIVGVSQGAVADESITEAKLDPTLSSSLMRVSVIPAGIITMWSGAEVPLGWLLCNGENGTPDLRNRFIVGAGSTYSIGNTGGSASVTLTEAQLPSHSHSLSTDGTHNHLFKVREKTSDGSTTGIRDVLAGRFSAGTELTGETINSQGTNYSFKVQTENSSTHTHTVGLTGSGESHENRPPYYALAFIMKA